MTTKTVKTQAQLDAAIADTNVTLIYIETDGDWVSLSVPEGREVRAVLRENSRAVLWENSHAVLRENSRAVLWENSHAVLRENSRAVLRENSHAVLWENSRAVLRENSRAVLWENSRAVLWENSRAVLWENSRADAKHTSGLSLYHKSSAKASPLVSIHIHSADAKVEGGHQIIVPPIHTVREWADYHGLDISNDGELTVYKAVSADLTSPHGALYEIGAEVEATDWNPRDCCGLGLHFSATPREAREYHRDAKRFLACRIHVDETTVIDQGNRGQDKVKARRCLVLHEVDIDGEPLPVAEEPKPAPKKASKKGK